MVHNLTYQKIIYYINTLMGQALSYIPAQYKKEMAATRSSGQNKNQNDKENAKSTNISQSRKQKKGTDDSSSGSKDQKGIKIITNSLMVEKL